MDYLPAQDPRIAAQFPEIPPDNLTPPSSSSKPTARFIPARKPFSARWRTIPAGNGRCAGYEKSPLFANLTEWAYRLVAENRTFFSRLTRWFWGRHVEPPTYFLTRWIFLRALGVIYLIAFVSLWTQISGLIGHDGILPTDQFMSAVAQQCDQQGIAPGPFLPVPTLCWFNASDGFLHFQCAAGSVLAVLLIFGIAPAPCLALLWLLYLSLVTVGRDFLGFQWDNLLLETGFLADFLRAAGNGCRDRPREPPPSRLVLWLLRLLLFKLMFSSGCVKLSSGDPTWRNLTALTFHYQTQPLPTWIGWYAQPIAAVVSKIVLRRDVCHRTRRAVPDFCAAATAISAAARPLPFSKS